jgi:glycosyltransferase involved in cell wall biosynthesis
VTYPDISVIIPVYNAMPYLVTCLSSVFEQSIGRDRLEVLAVDDGSTDGSGDLLDLLAPSWNGLRVVHEENSGGPSRPRNVGLDLATARYVYFIDADDYLGAEALERMFVLAEELGSDVVTSDRKPVGGLKGITDPDDFVPLAPRPRHSGMAASAYESAVRTHAAEEWTALVVAGADCKCLYRRDRIERLGLRFAEGVHFGEDTLFSARYLESASASIVADYDCYFERIRDDGGNLTTRYVGTERHLDALDRELRQQDDAQLRWRRDQLVLESVLDVTQQAFNQRFLTRDADTRRRLTEQARELLGTWLTPRTRARLPALDRLKAQLIAQGMEPELLELARAMAAGERAKDIIDGGRVYGGYPFFRDPASGVPDDCYDVTAELSLCHHLDSLSWQGSRLRLSGHAYIEHVDTAAMSTVVALCHQSSRAEYRLPARPVTSPGLARQNGLGRYDYGMAGFDVEIDLDRAADGGPLPAGRWGVFVAVTAQGVSKQAPLGGSRAGSTEAGVVAPSGKTAAVRAYFAKYGTLTLEVPGDQGAADLSR